jgi:hypothetical protein
MEKTALHPFPGLRPFEQDEEHLFFGREKAAADLLSRLRTSRFLTIIGTSGCGKSSLIKAGFLPSLYSGFMARTSSSWKVAFIRPGDNPIGRLAEVLAESGIVSQDADFSKFSEITLRRNSKGLIEIIKQARLPEHENVLVIVDQFEELFRYSKLKKNQLDRKQDTADFVNLLLECTRQREVPIFIVLAMRSDFLGDCTAFKGLPEAINDSQYLVPRMTREEIRAAIAGPIAVGGAEISHPLLSRLLNDVGDNPDQLPILQHALMRTWDYWSTNHREGEPLDFKHYEAIGTMERALSRHAEEAYAELKSKSNLAICEKMFKLLTQKGETGRGVRRPSKVSEICLITGASEEDVFKVINIFRQPGRTFLMPPSNTPLSADSVIDISHESLMRIWTRLIRWVKEETNSAELYLRLAQAASLHEKGKAGLWRDPDLMLALKWRDENKPNTVWAQRYDPNFEQATQFLESSKELQKREIKDKEKLRKIKTITAFLIIISITAVISIILSIRLYESRQEAKKQEAKAKKQEAKARRQAIIAKAASKNYEEQRDIAIDKQKVAEIAEKNAQKSAEKEKQAKIEAKNNERIANENARKAEKNKIRAQIEGLIAGMNKAEAEFGQYLAKAKKVAVHSIAITEDRELKTLLALTAFRLNAKAFTNLAQGTQKLYNTFKNTWNKFRGKEELAEEHLKLNKKYNELKEISAGKLVPPEIFEALRISYIAKEESEDNIFENTESWALAATGNQIVFNKREGELFRAQLHSQAKDKKLPGIKGKPIPLLKETGLQPSSFVDTKDRLFCGTMEGSIISWQKGKDEWKKDKSPPVQHNGKILSMAVSENKNCLVYSIKNTIYVHPLNSQNSPEKLDELENDCFARTLTVIEEPDSSPSVLIVGDGEGNIFHYDLLTEKSGRMGLNTDYKSNGSGFHSIAYNPARKLLALSNSRGEIILFPDILKNLSSGKRIQSFKVDKQHRGIVKALAFSSNGSYLASGGLDGTVMLWDLKGKKDAEIAKQVPLLTFHDKRKMKILALVFDPGNEYIIFNDKQNLRICPTHPEVFYDILSNRTERELRQDEWKSYIGESIKQEDVCPSGNKE